MCTAEAPIHQNGQGGDRRGHRARHRAHLPHAAQHRAGRGQRGQPRGRRRSSTTAGSSTTSSTWSPGRRAHRLRAGRPRGRASGRSGMVAGPDPRHPDRGRAGRGGSSPRRRTIVRRRLSGMLSDSDGGGLMRTEAAQELTVAKTGSTLTITFTRPDRLNAVTTDGLDDLADLLEEAVASDESVRVVVCHRRRSRVQLGADLVRAPSARRRRLTHPGPRRSSPRTGSSAAAGDAPARDRRGQRPGGGGRLLARAGLRPGGRLGVVVLPASPSSASR